MRTNYLLFLMVAYLFLLDLPTLSFAQQQDPMNTEDREVKESKSFYDFLSGQSAQDGVYLGMWSIHFVDDDEDYTNTHNLLGIVYKGYFAGTFLNSHQDRAYAAGVQRDIYSTDWNVFTVDTGYRLGIMYGYDDLDLFDTGFFPLLQLYADLSYNKVGVQFSWAGSVVTAGFFIRF